MNKMIGKISNKDWSGAPEGATHTFRHKYEDAHQQDGYYKLKDGKIYYWRTLGDWWDTTTHSHLELAVYCVSKEEDLRMDKKEVSKQVSCVEDLEVGMWLKSDIGQKCVVWHNNRDLTLNVVAVGIDFAHIHHRAALNSFVSWSYTYNGEYTPIVKETEAEVKIRELEATIALAQKQLQEYKGIK